MIKPLFSYAYNHISNPVPLTNSDLDMKMHMYIGLVGNSNIASCIF
jgi:hypothetical protein